MAANATVTYAEQVNENLVCGVCAEPFEDPQLLPCGHTFCRECLACALAVKHECPLDRCHVELAECRPAGRIVTNLVNELRVFCPHRDRGCAAIVERQALHAHLSGACELAEQRCANNGCPASFTRATRVAHEAVCAYVPTPCPLCEAPVARALLETHQRDDCPEAHVDCTRCGTSLRRTDLGAHADACVSAVVACPNASYGCTASFERRTRAEHLAVCALEPLRPFLDRQQQRLDEMAAVNTGLVQRVNELEAVVRALHDARQAGEMLPPMLPPMPLPLPPPPVIQEEMDLMRRENELLRQEIDLLREDTRRMDVLQTVQRSADSMRFHEELDVVTATTRTLQAQVSRLAAEVLASHRSARKSAFAQPASSATAAAGTAAPPASSSSSSAAAPAPAPTQPVDEAAPGRGPRQGKL